MFCASGCSIFIETTAILQLAATGNLLFSFGVAISKNIFDHVPNAHYKFWVVNQYIVWATLSVDWYFHICHDNYN